MSKHGWFLVVLVTMLFISVSPALSAKGDLSVNSNKAVVGTRLADLKSDKAQQNEVQRYIVILTDQPLALYNGGINGLKATSPQATGARKLDMAGDDCQAYLKHLNTKQAGALSAIGQALGESPEVSLRYQAVLNGFCLKMTGAQAKKVSGLAGVRSVVPDIKLNALTDAGPEWIGASDVWNGVGGITSTHGEGVVVGIIDSGINPLNPSFADVGGDAYDHTNPRGQFYGVCNSSFAYYDPTFPCNDKLIGAYNFARDESDPYGSPLDDDGHGSHTASTTAGNVITAAMPILGGTAPALTRQISGVAPHANIIAYRGLEEGSGWTTWLAAAIEQAAIDQVDVINYSIGGSASDPWLYPDSLAFLAARALGTFASVSAGNSGPGAGTMGSPATSPWVLGVGSSTHDRSLVTHLTGLTGTGVGALADIEGMGIGGAYGPVAIVYAGNYSNGETNPGLCDAAFPAGTFSGEIVVCDRGDAHMEMRLAKGENVLTGGAGGMVLANGSDMVDSMVAMNHVLPAVSITYQDGVALKAWLAAGSDHVGSLSEYTVVENDTARADRMAAYSSRGPNTMAPSVIKPDVCTPGDNIYAAYGEDGAVEYAVLIGTSMASPHAAGAAALLAAARPDLSPAEIQSAMTTTAQTNIRQEDSATAAGPFDMGGGRVDVAQAARAALVLDETMENYLAVDPYFGGDPSTLNLATLGQDQVVATHTWTRTLRSTLGTDSTWTTSVTNPSIGTLTVTPNEFTVPAGGTQQVQVTVNMTGALLDQWYHGQVMFQSSGQVDIKLPVAVKQVISNLDGNLRLDQVGYHQTSSVAMRAAVEVTDFTAVISGMVPGTISSGNIYQDPTPDEPFDDLTPEGGVMIVETLVGANAQRIVAEIADTTAPDLDLYLVHLDSGYILCSSTSYTSDEYCNIDSPPEGTYWTIIQNWQASDTTGATPDPVTVAVGVVGNQDAGNLDVTAQLPNAHTQTAISAGADFNLLLDWYLFKEPRYWYGAFTIGTDPANPANLGRANVDIVHNGRGPEGSGGGGACFIKTTK